MTSYVKSNDFIKNKFLNESLPKDGKIKDINGLRRMNFVIDKNGKLIIGKKHQTLGNEDDVLAARQLKVEGNGMITKIDNDSGHYRPAIKEATEYPEVFEQAGFDLDKAWLDLDCKNIIILSVSLEEDII